MNEWWAGISLLERALFVVGTSSALILFIQTILLIIGGHDEGSMGSDTSGLSEPELEGEGWEVDLPDEAVGSGTELDTGLRLFSIRGIMGFLAVGSWTGIAALEGGLIPLLAIVVALAAGLLSMVLIAKLVQLLSHLQENGTVSQRSALGESGTVYIPIPEHRSGAGKVHLVLGDQLMELDAVTEGERIPTGAQVRVVDLSSGVLVVERD